jgi:translocation and assembly module TamB
VERGVLTFANPARIDPYLDIVATTRIQDYAVMLNVSGAMSRPLTAFSSDPPLPDLEILGLLTTGAPLESPVFTDVGGTGGEGSRSVAAEAVLYGQAASLVTQRVGKLFGIDRVRVEPLTSGDTVGAARVTVGKRLSSDVFVTYSYDPSSTAEDIFQVEWRVSQQLMLVLTQNGDESYALDARWEARF